MSIVEETLKKEMEELQDVLDYVQIDGGESKVARPDLRKKPWQTVELGYLTIPIHIIDMGDTRTFGYFHSFPSPYIAISDKVKGSIFMVTVFHELNHAGAFVYGRDDEKLDEETWVDLSAAIVTEVFKRNPAFKKAIFEEAGL